MHENQMMPGQINKTAALTIAIDQEIQDYRIMRRPINNSFLNQKWIAVQAQSSESPQI